MSDEELITNIEDFRHRYLSSDRRVYPVRLDIQVTTEEATAILNMLRANRVYDYPKHGTGAH